MLATTLCTLMSFPPSRRNCTHQTTINTLVHKPSEDAKTTEWLLTPCRAEVAQAPVYSQPGTAAPVFRLPKPGVAGRAKPSKHRSQLLPGHRRRGGLGAEPPVLLQRARLHEGAAAGAAYSLLHNRPQRFQVGCLGGTKGQSHATDLTGPVAVACMARDCATSAPASSACRAAVGRQAVLAQRLGVPESSAARFAGELCMAAFTVLIELVDLACVGFESLGRREGLAALLALEHSSCGSGGACSSRRRCTGRSRFSERPRCRIRRAIVQVVQAAQHRRRGGSLHVQVLKGLPRAVSFALVAREGRDFKTPSLADLESLRGGVSLQFPSSCLALQESEHNHPSRAQRSCSSFQEVGQPQLFLEPLQKLHFYSPVEIPQTKTQHTTLYYILYDTIRYYTLLYHTRPLYTVLYYIIYCTIFKSGPATKSRAISDPPSQDGDGSRQRRPSGPLRSPRGGGRPPKSGPPLSPRSPAASSAWLSG